MLFQVHFLSLLLEERGHGVAGARSPTTCTPSSCAGTRTSSARSEVDSAGEVLKNWDQIKKGEDGREPGIFGDVPENLPGPLYALKTQRRAASTGFDFDHVPYEGVRGELEELEAAQTREERFHEVGDVLFAAVNVARKLKVDPELALRAVVRALPAAASRPRRSSRQRDGHDVGRAGSRRSGAYYARATARGLAYRGSADEPDRIGPRARDPRFPRESHCRGRSQPRAPATGSRAVRRFDRSPRGGRAAGRRRAYRGKGVLRAVAMSMARSPRGRRQRPVKAASTRS